MTRATDRHKSLHELNPMQALALERIDAGATHAEAAEAAGVHRTTVTRWATHHPAFITELNQRRIERASENARRLRELTFEAIRVVAEAIEDGDLSAAFRWLKMFPPGSGRTYISRPTTPEEHIESVRQKLPEHWFHELEEASGRTVENAMEAILADLGEGDGLTVS